MTKRFKKQLHCGTKIKAKKKKIQLKLNHKKITEMKKFKGHLASEYD
jgi:hypothetical protein